MQPAHTPMCFKITGAGGKALSLKSDERKLRGNVGKIRFVGLSGMEGTVMRVHNPDDAEEVIPKSILKKAAGSSLESKYKSPDENAQVRKNKYAITVRPK